MSDSFLDVAGKCKLYKVTTKSTVKPDSSGNLDSAQLATGPCPHPASVFKCGQAQVSGGDA